MKRMEVTMNGLKRYWIPVVVFVLLFGSVFAVAPQTHAAAAQPPVSTLVAIRAAYHPEAKPRYDRVVFQFSGPVPQIDPHPGYVKQLIGDGSGLPVPISSKAILQFTMRPAQAIHEDHGRITALPARIKFRLRNVQEVVRTGDFEAVLTYGIGLRHRSNFRVFTLTHPSRVVVDFLNP
jgi:hypothetical protein